jgi:drug/metabolite transporter (DMT)-like permease
MRVHSLYSYNPLYAFLMLGLMHWLLGIVVVLLVGLNTLFWGFALKEMGDPELNLGFILELVFNRWFMLAMVSGFTVAVLSYWVYSALGVMLGRFFLSISIVSVLIVGVFVLGERISLEQWIGVVLVTIGVLLIGRA